MKFLAFLAVFGTACLTSDTLPAVVISRQLDPPLAPNTRGYYMHDGPSFVYQGKKYVYDWVSFPLAIDIDSNGTIDVKLIKVDFEERIAAYAIGGSYIWGRGGGVMGLDFGSYARAFYPGDVIGPELVSPDPWIGWHNDDSTRASATLNGTTSGVSSGEFIGYRDEILYLGVKFEREGAAHYGWVVLDGAGIIGREIHVHGWAYESEPGVGLIVGRVPEPASMLLLAGAGAGLSLRRRR